MAKQYIEAKIAALTAKVIAEDLRKKGEGRQDTTREETRKLAYDIEQAYRDLQTQGEAVGWVKERTMREIKFRARKELKVQGRMQLIDLPMNLTWMVYDSKKAHLFNRNAFMPEILFALCNTNMFYHQDNVHYIVSDKQKYCKKCQKIKEK